MTDVIVSPTIPGVASPDLIMPGRAVRSATFVTAAELYHYLLGRGAQHVPWYSPAPSGNLTSGSANVVSFRTKPNVQCLQRAWFFVLESTQAGHTVQVRAPSSGTYANYFASAAGSFPRPQLLIETLASQSGSETTIDIDFQPDNSATATLMGLCCVDVPRGTLVVNTTDLAVDPTQAKPGQPIWCSSSGTVGLYRLWDTLEDTTAIGRRVGQFMWAVNTANKWSTAAGPTNIFSLAPPMLARAVALDNTASAAAATGTISVRVYASCTSTANAKVDLSATSGGSLTISGISGTSYAWYPSTGGAAGSLTVDAESMTANDGRQGSTWDDVTFTGTVTSGSGNLQVASVCCWEA